MDIHRIIRDLNEERDHLNRIIKSLELVAKTGGGYSRPPGRRGRKFMDRAARQEVSERMKRYWAGRREERANRMDEASFPAENPAHPAYTN